MAAPRALAGRLQVWTPGGRERDVLAWTGLSAPRWRQLVSRFPELPSDPGPPAARARRRMAELATGALEGKAWSPDWDGPALPGGPAVYVTAHIGSLLLLRYVLRAHGAAVASVLAPYNFDRADPAAKDARFDRRFPMSFPHVVSSERTHRLRSLLKRGGLILAADLPARQSFPATLLGGAVELDPRPFRLARMAGVPCVPAFLTMRGRRWSLSLEEPLPADEREAHARFASAFAGVAARAPVDLDGVVYWNRTFGRAP